MARRHRKTYDALHANPIRANIAWNEAVTMFEALVTGSGGSMYSVDLNGVSAVFHRPHPGNELSRARVRAIRQFLENAGANPDDL